MDNSISDDNINTVAAAAVVAASTATAAVGTPTITKNSSCDGLQSSIDYGGQSVVHNDDNDIGKNNSDKSCSPTIATTADEFKTKEYLLRRNDASYKRITSKCISRAKDLVHKCQSDPGGSRVTPTLNLSANRSPQSRSTLRHQSPSCSSSSSNTASTTRKCVLTLDGYNYVIVASSPDNKSKPENLTGVVSSELELKSPINDTIDSEARSQISPSALQQPSTPTLNGLISIRRSSTKKSDYFAKRYSQPQLNTGLEFSYPTNTTAYPHQNSPVESASDTPCGLETATGNRRKPYLNRRSPIYRFSCDNFADDYHQQHQHRLKSGDTVTTFGDRCTFSGAEEISDWYKMQSDSVSSSSSSTVATSTTSQNRCLTSTEHDGNEQGTVATNPVDLTTDNLPAVDTPDACDKAALRLRCILKLLQRGDVSVEILQKNLHYAARVLEALYIDETKQESKIANEKKHSTDASTKDNDSKVQRRLADEDDELSEVQPDAVPPEVREWLASTFTRQLVTTRKRTEEKPKFRTVAHAIRAGIFVDRIYRRVSSTAMLQFPPEVVKVLKTLDDWSFDQFALATATNGQPIKYLGYDLLNRYGIIHKFKVSPTILEQFLVKIEEGYCRYQNPYHNNLHAADVAQTIHYMLSQTGVMHYLTDLEIFAILIAALIHDYEHTGTTNSFHINTGSDMAMLYNDRAVLENHHASAAFRMLKEDEYNIFSSLSREEYKEIRNLVIDMVISTDMSFHNQQLKNMKSLIAIASSDTHYNKTNVDLKFKALSFILHCCDISHPAKKWEIHHRWTMLLIEEFFRQGDLERELGLDISPLCDRNSTVIPKSQIVFIEVIVEPSLAVCADLLELILTPIASQTGNKTTDNSTIAEESQKSTSNTSKSDPSQPQRILIKKPWITCMKENKRIWKEQEVAETSNQPSLSTEESSDPDANVERPSSS
ncbi:calcium/calmodulin-dependent 3',5'-cyclic nucleotide phosphodiesterase 1A-like isoform X3 [Contarinia nasturtii]|uniref:calcium/calmodulin-dependent 3',5'-cyclic nucleotide phosphodiesterase 1A-like isoform X3 n=1 Tax=Contarinia nasturtii TaxID=265458 RepID=UPI0012D3CF8F|nr:calcium/calmodulin-dependent 3',5'-cyclic nucleotide phosphodiesterase 1A-like isoform X3 [Contarinia nasturtii]